MPEPDEESLPDAFWAVARRLRGLSAGRLAPHAVTPSQLRALRTVLHGGELRLSALSDALQIAPRSATEVVDALQQRGLVERVPDPADRRAIGVVPTSAGREAEAAIEAARADEAESYLAGLDDADRTELERLLTKVAEDVENAVPTGSGR